MKIKTILIAFLAASLLLGAAACGPTQREQEYIDAAKAVAENIPMPTYYCPHHGVAYELEGGIKCALTDYSLSTGEPILKITQGVKCPDANGWVFGCSSWETETNAYFLVAESGAKTEYTISLNELQDDTITKVWRCGP